MKPRYFIFIAIQFVGKPLEYQSDFSMSWMMKLKLGSQSRQANHYMSQVNAGFEVGWVDFYYGATKEFETGLGSRQRVWVTLPCLNESDILVLKSGDLCFLSFIECQFSIYLFSTLLLSYFHIARSHCFHTFTTASQWHRLVSPLLSSSSFCCHHLLFHYWHWEHIAGSTAPTSIPCPITWA